MLSKELRDKKVFGKKCARESKRIIKTMDDYISSENPVKIEIAEAFYRILAYHVTEGDLTVENVQLAGFLRKDE